MRAESDVVCRLGKARLAILADFLNRKHNLLIFAHALLPSMVLIFREAALNLYYSRIDFHRPQSISSPFTMRFPLLSIALAGLVSGTPNGAPML
jgi:hypothetical protein